ncbi:MAG: hypothetical protein ACE5I3_06655 [Phycisphaerae bacterium]
MDRGAVVARTEAPAGTVQLEQAVFTSMRSPMGRGYQIVAASAGISTDEKKEIVQCAPSHGSLCDPTPTAVGLASFELRSGRRCLFLARNAGVEHTARGGYRIHTHVLIMDQSVFRRFRCDPLGVQAAALPVIGEERAHDSSKRLDPIALSTKTGEPATRRIGAVHLLATSDLDCVTSILAAVLSGRRILVVGARAPQELLAWVLGATPTAVRRRLSMSYGLKFSPSRRFQLVFADADRDETERIRRDHDIDLFHWGSRSSGARSPFDTWLRFVRQRWEAGRHDDIDRLATRLTRESSAHELAQIATLCADIERLPTADRLLLDRLIERHSRVTPVSEAHARLLGDFKKAAERRKAASARAKQESSPDGEATIIGLA